jgi:periplasmic protein CpxP/Spy
MQRKLWQRKLWQRKLWQRKLWQRKFWHQSVWAGGLALQLCATAAFAQSAPATTPSTPPVTTPPPPAANPPTGGPNSLPPSEPANAIDSGNSSAPGTGIGRLSKGANSFTEAQARSRLQQHGYRQISALIKDQDGIWRGSATRDGHQMHVGLDYKGNISNN